eukprot:4925574-Amphidinium_carterae.1
MNLLARELALEFCSVGMYPKVVEHTPGVANTTADTLSRLMCEGYELPSFLRGVPRSNVPARSDEYYLSAGFQH